MEEISEKGRGLQFYLNVHCPEQIIIIIIRKEDYDHNGMKTSLIAPRQGKLDKSTRV